ncbi:hypothetical protein NLI96_g2646 [Meripilus lineatus]|uniref:FAD-binding FR-type domain-containing protein n=1 Tax=Meripilus lineatus TaxID=2056292 RepID=A0AAD5V7X0_9APHY|nr:hypothetical protein NLI96_g2646 [Physisporinus lineatus]
MVWVHLWARWMLNHNIFARAWITAGTVGCVAYTMLVFGSFGAIRRRFYETFWWSHFVLVAVYIFTTWVHLKGARNDYTYYVWPAFIIWGIDRLFRYIRYLVINFLKPKDIPGELELLDADSLRLTVKRTILWDGKLASTCSFHGQPLTRLSLTRSLSLPEGLTATLKKRVLEKGATTVPTLVEGPYGAPPDITPFTTCIFVAGGSGVCYTYPRFEETIRNLPSDLAVVINIHLTKKEMLPMQTLEKEYDEAPHLHEKGRTLSVDNELSPKTSRDPEKNLPTALSSKVPSISDSDNFRGLEAMGVNILQGRPDLYKILEDEVANSEGPVSVDVSGPTPLVSDIRKALSKPFAGPMATLRGAPIIQLNTEDFTM